MSTPRIRRLPRILLGCYKKTVENFKELYQLFKGDDINKRDFVCTILAALAIFVFDMWSYARYNSREVNWFIVAQPADTLPTISWYWKELGTKITMISLCGIIYSLTKMRQWLRVVATCLIVFFSIELILFFVCFNRTSAVGTYFVMMIIIARAVFLKVLSRKYKSRTKVYFDSKDEGIQSEIEIRTIREHHHSA